MRLRRDIAAAALLLAFVVGSLAAPLSHYLFMALSDAYPPFQEEVVHQDSAAHHEAPSGHATHHATAPSLLEEGSAFSSAHNHQFCDYADLFATFAATGLQDNSNTLELDFEAFRVEHHQMLHAQFYALYNSRAPPIA